MVDEKIVEAVAQAYAKAAGWPIFGSEHKDAIRAAITAYQAEAWQGWKLVPIEPTAEMMDAAIALVEAGPCFPQDIFAAMVKAAPKATP